MTLIDAQDMAQRIRNDETLAAPVRILPEDIDPIMDGDNGWDVEVMILDKWSV